jgi:hypothetical protein
VRLALAAVALVLAACSASGPDPGSDECRRAYDEYRGAFNTAMGDRMAQLGAWADKPDMQADLAVGQEMAQAMTEITLTRAGLETMRARETRNGHLAPEWEGAFGAAARAIDRCGEGVAPSR